MILAEVIIMSIVLFVCSIIAITIGSSLWFRFGFIYKWLNKTISNEAIRTIGAILVVFGMLFLGLGFLPFII